MSHSKIELHIAGFIATITLNRPEKLNALDPDMMNQLEACIIELEENQNVRVILLTGAGNKAFCVGADINAWSALEPLAMWRQWIRMGHRIFNRLAALPQPVFAVLNGYTLGGGLELALAADLRIAADTAQLAMPEVTIGTIPGWTGSQRLPELIGISRAKQMIFTGNRIPASKAEQWGLVNEVFPADKLLDKANSLASTIVENSPVAVQLAKQLINASSGRDEALTIEGFASALAATTDDNREGIASFKERRPAKFSGR